MNCKELKENFIASIRDDFVSGSMTITYKAILELKSLLYLCPIQSKTELNTLLNELKNAKPTMQALRNAVEYIELKARHRGVESIIEILYDLLRDLDSTTEWTISKSIAFVLKKFTKRNLLLLTTSFSSTINKFLENLNNLKRIQLLVLESKWKDFDYSKQTFDFATRIGIHCEIADIEKLKLFANDIDFATSGADCVSFDNGIVNGFPTHAMARFCKEQRIPYFVVAESIKYSEKCNIEEGFDFIPIELISGIFSDGIFTSDMYKKS
ncbi:MAG: hypothetical protein ACPLX7_08515 [Candidatus Kapaibacteriota bacterium]|jgi:translation initiation factor 2B subunit (eIF-2B alpha/beta/delta family)